MKNLLATTVYLALAACGPSRTASDHPGGELIDGSPGPRADGPDNSCERIEVHSTPQVSNVLVVLDRSGSMYCDNPNFCHPTVDRWTPAVQAITTLTATFQQQIRFGLMLFANPDAPAGQTLCGAGKVDVPVDYQQGGRIASALAGDPSGLTGSWTPTATSLAAAGTALTSSPLDGMRYIVLVTDGAPNCNAGLDGHTCSCVGADPASCGSQPQLCLDDARTVHTIQDLAARGVRTYIVGYDTSSWSPVLDAMAAAGGTGYAQHFEVSSAPALRTALQAIAGGLASCTFELEAAPIDLIYIRVTVDGVSIPNESVHPSGPGHGWRLVGEKTVELLGDDCQRLQTGTSAHQVTIVRECDPVVN